MDDDRINILFLKQPLLILNQRQLSFLSPLHCTTLIETEIAVFFVLFL